MASDDGFEETIASKLLEHTKLMSRDAGQSALPFVERLTARERKWFESGFDSQRLAQVLLRSDETISFSTLKDFGDGIAAQIIPPERSELLGGACYARLKAFVDSFIRQSSASFALPDIVDYLDSATKTDRDVVLVELIIIDLRLRWRSGRRIYVDDYLQRWPELRHAAEHFRRIVSAEFLSRATYDSTPPFDEFRTRFPNAAPAAEELALMAARAKEARIDESYQNTERFFWFWSRKRMLAAEYLANRADRRG